MSKALVPANKRFINKFKNGEKWWKINNGNTMYPSGPIFIQRNSYFLKETVLFPL